MVAYVLVAHRVTYQCLEALQRAVRASNPSLNEFEASLFDGYYVTGDVTADYLSHLARERDETRGENEESLLAAG